MDEILCEYDLHKKVNDLIIQDGTPSQSESEYDSESCETESGQEEDPDFLETSTAKAMPSQTLIGDPDAYKIHVAHCASICTHPVRRMVLNHELHRLENPVSESPKEDLSPKPSWVPPGQCTFCAGRNFRLCFNCGAKGGTKHV